TLDIMPTCLTWDRMRGTGGLGAYHWYFLAQRHDLPERLIGNDPRYFLHWTLRSWARDFDAFTPEALAAYEAAFSDPGTIRATCDDYRAGATIDDRLDREDLAAGRKIEAPMLVLWGERDDRPGGDAYLDAWRQFATDVR